jgi:hypothetical protein
MARSSSPSSVFCSASAVIGSRRTRHRRSFDPYVYISSLRVWSAARGVSRLSGPQRSPTTQPPCLHKIAGLRTFGSSSIKYLPRPGNLWVPLARTAAITCSAAPVSNGFSDINSVSWPFTFPGGFFSSRFMSWALKHSSISLPAAPRASPDRFASEPPSIGRSERSSVIDSFMLGTTQSAPFVGPGWSDGQKLPTNFAEDPESLTLNRG